MNITGEMVRLFIIRGNLKHWTHVLATRTIRDKEEMKRIRKALAICKAALAGE